MNLNELIKQYSLLENDEGELCENWQEKMDALGDTINAKLEGACALVLAFEQRADAVDAEIERLKRLKVHCEGRAKGLKNWLAYCLSGQKTEAGSYRISFRKTEAVEVIDESLIPEAYMRVKVVETKSPAKDDIKADLKAGAEIPGVALRHNISTIIK